MVQNYIVLDDKSRPKYQKALNYDAVSHLSKGSSTINMSKWFIEQHLPHFSVGCWYREVMTCVSCVNLLYTAWNSWPKVICGEIKWQNWLILLFQNMHNISLILRLIASAKGDNINDQNGGTTFPGVRVSRQRPVGRGVVTTWENSKLPFWK